MTEIQTIEGLDEVLVRLIAARKGAPIAAALKAAGANIKAEMQAYPQQKTGRKMAFKSEKQRRYFFWALKRGLIEVPYRRGLSPGSSNLKQLWRVVLVSPVRVEIQNSARYAKWVHSAKDQALIHKGTWITDEQAVAKHKDTTVALIREGFRKTLAGQGGP